MKTSFKYFLFIFVTFIFFSQSSHAQETKISLIKYIESDSLIKYSLVIIPYKGDSIYRFEIFILDTLEKGYILISNPIINISVSKTEREIFFTDKSGKKHAKFEFYYIIKNNDEYSDKHLKIPLCKSRSSLIAELSLKPVKSYKLIFNNSNGVTKEFELN